MMTDTRRPFGTLIANYMVFRLALLDQRLTSADLEITSEAEVMVTNVDDNDGELLTEISVIQRCGQAPLGLRGYLQVSEKEQSALGKVLVKRAIHGANNPDIELDEIWLDGNSSADYLGRFWTFLVTGKWD